MGTDLRFTPIKLIHIDLTADLNSGAINLSQGQTEAMLLWSMSKVDYREIASVWPGLLWMICSLALLQPFSFHETLIYAIVVENSLLCGNLLRIARLSIQPRSRRARLGVIPTKYWLRYPSVTTLRFRPSPIRHHQKRLPEQNLYHLFPLTSNHGNLTEIACFTGRVVVPSSSQPSPHLLVVLSYRTYLNNDTNNIVVLPSTELLESRPRSFLHDDRQIRAYVYSREPCYLTDPSILVATESFVRKLTENPSSKFSPIWNPELWGNHIVGSGWYYMFAG